MLRTLLTPTGSAAPLVGSMAASPIGCALPATAPVSSCLARANSDGVSTSESGRRQILRCR